MMIAGVYSFNEGREALELQYADELSEVKQIIGSCKFSCDEILVYTNIENL